MIINLPTLFKLKPHKSDKIKIPTASLRHRQNIHVSML